MKKVVLGSGDYYKATTSDDLQGTFNEIAKSIIASSKNVMLRTSRGYFDEEYPKYFRFKFEANGYKDSVDAKMVGTPQEGYEMQIIKEYNKYVTFNNPTYGNVDAETGKVHIPLNNLKFIVNGNELQFDFEVYVSNDNLYYYYDVEDASKSESISKRIAVVLVLDCSTSMGNAFVPMKQAAIDFIETLENMDPNAGTGTMSPVTGTVNGHDYVDLGLPSGTKWATINVGATTPEAYGNYYAWGETETKSSYTLNNYKWYDAVNGEYIKPNSAVTRSATTSKMLKSSADYQYYLNGTLPGTDWNFGYGFNGTATIFCEAGVNYEFKITEGASWNDQYGFSSLAFVPEGVIESGTYGGNIGFSIPMDGYVTISISDGLIILSSSVGFGGYYTPEWDGNYYIAGKGVEGSGFCCDEIWDASACSMTNGTITYTALPVGDYSFKITNGTWNQCWGYFNLADYTGLTTDDDYNILFTLSEASDVTISFDGLYISVDIKKINVTDSSQEGYSVLVNGTDLYKMKHEGVWDMDPSYDQHSLKGVELKAGDTFVFYNNSVGGEAWANAIVDAASLAGIEGTGTEFIVTASGCYAIYLKTKYMEDNVYFGYGDCNSTLINLGLADDAANVNWGGDWRMPTKEEQDELRNTSYTTWTWTTQNGVYGYKVTSKANGNSIFLPAAGYRSNSSLNLTGTYGGYWTSSPSNESSSAYLLYFGTNNDINISDSYRYYGQSIRPVLR